MTIPNRLRELQEACEEASIGYWKVAHREQDYMTITEARGVLANANSYLPATTEQAKQVVEAYRPLDAANTAFEEERTRVLIEAVGEEDKELLG